MEVAGLMTTEIALPVLNIVGATTSIFLTLFLTDYSDIDFSSPINNSDDSGLLALPSGPSYPTYPCVKLLQNGNQDCNQVERQANASIEILTMQIIESLQTQQIMDAVTYWKLLEIYVLNSTEITMYPTHLNTKEVTPTKVLIQKLSYILTKLIKLSPTLQLSLISPFMQEIDLELRLSAYNLTIDKISPESINIAINADTELSNFNEDNGENNNKKGNNNAKFLNFAKLLRNDYDWVCKKKSDSMKTRTAFYSIIKKFPQFVRTMIFTTTVILRSSINCENTNASNGYLYATGNKALFPSYRTDNGQDILRKRPVFVWSKPTPNFGIAKEGRWQILHDDKGTYTIFNTFWKEYLCVSVKDINETIIMKKASLPFTTSQGRSSNELKCSWEIIWDGYGFVNSGSVRIYVEIKVDEGKPQQFFLLPEKYDDTTRDKTRNYRSSVSMSKYFVDEENAYNSWDIVPLVNMI